MRVSYWLFYMLIEGVVVLETKDELTIRIGENIKTKRLQLQLTQDNLVEMSGTAKNIIIKIERGYTNYSITSLKKITDAMNVSLSWAASKRPEK